MLKPFLTRLMAVASFSAAITVAIAEPNAADAATLISSLASPLLIDSESAEGPSLSLDLLAATNDPTGVSAPSLDNLSAAAIVEEFTRTPDNDRTTVALADLLGSFNN